MASTAIHNVITRPMSAAVAAIKFTSTNLSTSSTQAYRSLAFGTPVNQISAQALYTSTAASASITLRFDGSLLPAAGWTAIKSTVWTSTQAGTVRSILAPSSRCYSHLRVVITDFSSQPGANLADVTIALAAR